jgi:nucleotide-binding universal stress UspA family protein
MIPRLALRRLCEAGVPEERVRVTVHPGFGAGVAAALLDLASHRRAAMLVIASHARHGIDRLLHGSVETNVIARATMPVLVARAHR